MRSRPTSLHHIHILANDKYKLAKWYQEYLGFKIVEDIEALGETEGPLFISADGGKSGLSIFNRKPRHEGVTINARPAFDLAPECFLEAHERLSTLVDTPYKLYDHLIFFSFYPVDLDNMPIEITCYQYHTAKTLLDKSSMPYFAENPSVN